MSPAMAASAPFVFPLLLPGEAVYSCNICQKTVEELDLEATGGCESDNDDGECPSIRKAATQLWMTECAHIVCSQHLKGGGVPFYSSVKYPRAACPVCSANGDTSLKDLKAVSRFLRDEAVLPNSSPWLQYPAMTLDASTKEAEAMRVQFTSLLLSRQVSHHRMRKAEKLCRSNEHVNTENSRLLEEVAQLKARNDELLGAERELRKWKSREPEIRHYLDSFTRLADEARSLKTELARLGYKLPHTEYVFRGEAVNGDHFSVSRASKCKGTNGAYKNDELPVRPLDHTMGVQQPQEALNVRSSPPSLNLFDNSLGSGLSEHGNVTMPSQSAAAIGKRKDIDAAELTSAKRVKRISSRELMPPPKPRTTAACQPTPAVQSREPTIEEIRATVLPRPKESTEARQQVATRPRALHHDAQTAYNSRVREMHVPTQPRALSTPKVPAVVPRDPNSGPNTDTAPLGQPEHEPSLRFVRQNLRTGLPMTSIREPLARERGEPLRPDTALGYFVRGASARFREESPHPMLTPSRRQQNPFFDVRGAPRSGTPSDTQYYPIHIDDAAYPVQRSHLHSCKHEPRALTEERYELQLQAKQPFRPVLSPPSMQGHSHGGQRHDNGGEALKSPFFQAVSASGPIFNAPRRHHVYQSEQHDPLLDGPHPNPQAPRHNGGRQWQIPRSLNGLSFINDPRNSYNESLDHHHRQHGAYQQQQVMSSPLMTTQRAPSVGPARRQEQQQPLFFSEPIQPTHQEPFLRPRDYRPFRRTAPLPSSMPSLESTGQQQQWRPYHFSTRHASEQRQGRSEVASFKGARSGTANVDSRLAGGSFGGNQLSRTAKDQRRVMTGLGAGSYGGGGRRSMLSRMSAQR